MTVTVHLPCHEHQQLTMACTLIPHCVPGHTNDGRVTPMMRQAAFHLCTADMCHRCTAKQ
jgi:hypothetical protein